MGSPELNVTNLLLLLLLLLLLWLVLRARASPALGRGDDKWLDRFRDAVVVLTQAAQLLCLLGFGFASRLHDLIANTQNKAHALCRRTKKEGERERKQAGGLCAWLVCLVEQPKSRNKRERGRYGECGGLQSAWLNWRKR